MPPSLQRGAIAGAGASVLTILVNLLVRFLVGLPTLPELVETRLVQATPGPVFGFLIDRLQLVGRPLLFGSLLLAEVVALAVLGGVFALWWERGPTRPRGGLGWEAIAGGVGLWLVLGLVVFPLFGDGPFATGAGYDAATLVVGELALSLLYALLTAVLWQALTAQEGAAAASPLRRQLIGSATIGALATAAGTVLWRYRVETAPFSAAAPAAGSSSSGTATTAMSSTMATAASGTAAAAARVPPPVTPAVTANANFYLVSKNLVDPVLQAGNWQISVQGLVKQPLTLHYAQLTALPAVEQYRTFECISNDVGGNLMSNALWRGVRLSTLLTQAGADTGQPYVLFRSADGYTESLPMAEALKPTSLVAYAMNGAPLPSAHGFPARVVLLGHYGMKQPKWLTQITVSPTQQAGFWEQQGWNPQAAVQTTARIDAPKDGARVPLGPVAFSGVAFAGDRGIRQVQLSVDGGKSWQATHVEPALGAGVWSLWSVAWQPPKAGSYTVQARATDGTGAVQTAQGADSFPSGAAGYDQISIQAQ